MQGTIAEKRLKGQPLKKNILKGQINNIKHLKGYAENKNSIFGVMKLTSNLEGVMNVGVKKIKETISFMPYVENEVLYFKSQASVEESELIISG